MESYTFLYVPYNPLDILVNCKKFVHLPYTFLYIPCNSSTKSVWDTALQLPKGLSSCAWDSHSCPNVAISFPFLYVPLYVPIRSCTLQSHKGLLSSCAWFPTPVLMWPSCLRSYTFRYEFLYVLVRCRRTRLYVEGCPHTPLSLHP